MEIVGVAMRYLSFILPLFYLPGESHSECCTHVFELKYY